MAIFLPPLPPSSCFFAQIHLLPSHAPSNFLSFPRTTARFPTLLVSAAGADFYATLGLRKSASSKEIKAAYRRLARQFHPDVNKQPGATEKFLQISTAYEVLSDGKKRALYDRFGGSVEGESSAYATNPFDLFMGGAGFPDNDPTQFGTSHQQTKGQDIRYDITLEFSEAIFGTQKEFELYHMETCEICKGTGAKIGSKIRVCSTCGGKGQVMTTEQTRFGLLSQVSVCPDCGGDGEVISEYCSNCRGGERIRVKKNIEVKVPPGVSSGSLLRVAGEGDAGPRGIPGFQRDGINLRPTISVSYLDAILGTVVKVKTVEGMSELGIPPGTQPGDVLVLARKGTPILNNTSIRGDHLFTIEVTIPKCIRSVS